jgi:ubiquinone biosynthesis O-methyltransferase
MSKIVFSKYQKRGAYHWGQIGNHPMKSNAFVKARYGKCVNLLRGSIKNSSKVLDLGCGDGALTYLLYREGYKMTGIDTSQLGVDLAIKQHEKRKTSCNFYCMNSKELPDSSFDAIVCSDVIEHVDDARQLINDIYRILKPGGMAVISTPIRITEEVLDSEHVVEWFPLEFEKLFVRFDAQFYISHPVVFMELMKQRWLRVMINLMTIAINPFYWKKNFRFFALQFVCINKEL